MKLASSLSLCLAGSLAASAGASIVSTTGMCTQISAPPSALPGAMSATNAWAWDEATNIPLAAMPVDLSTNPSDTNSPVPGFLTSLVDSHFINFDGVPGIVITGTVTFSSPILAVQYRDGNLDLTDGLATTGTVYPTTLPFRGFNNWTGGDFVDINGTVLTFQFSSVDPVLNLEQVRVFTKAIPAPGSAAMLGLGALLAARRRRA